MVYYKSLIFFLIAYSGYVQDVTKVQQSQRSSNLYYDVMFQMSVMHQRGGGNKRQLFLDKMAAGQPIRLSNMPVATSGTVFLNKGTVIMDLPPHSLTFQFHEPKTNEVTSIKDLQKYSSGTFAISGCIQ
jgi:hypothetical protein